MASDCATWSSPSLPAGKVGTEFKFVSTLLNDGKRHLDCEKYAAVSEDCYH